MGFADGFRTGEGLVNRYRAGVRADEEAALRKTEAARAEEQFGWQRTAQERLQKQNTELDGINQQLRGMPQGYNANTGQQAPDTSGADPTAWSSPEQRQNYGMQIAKPPTGVAATELMRQAALVKGDYNASITLEDRSKSQKWEEAYAGALKEYTGAPEQIGPTAKYLNSNSRSITMGAPGKNGIVPLSIAKPDGEAMFINLSKPEQAQLYAAGKLMSTDPQRALSIMAGVNKDLASVVAAENNLTMNVGKANNAATVQSAGIDNDNARLGLDKERLGIQRATAGAQIAATKARTEMDKMGAAQYFTGEDGNTYASIPTMGKKGLEFSTVRVNPDNVRLSKPGGKPEPATSKVEDPGVPYKDNRTGKLMYTDGRGGYIAEGGVLPTDRAKYLEKAGVPTDAIGSLPWSKDGTSVLFANQAYAVTSPEEMRALQADMNRLGRNTRLVEEESRKDYHLSNNKPSGMGPRITYQPDPRAPSIYDGPDEWAKYRNQR